MAKIDRLERLDAQRVDLEAEYRAALVAALREAIAGKAGLFGRTEGKDRRAKAPAIIAELTDLADEIDTMRERLFLDPFALHPQFMAARGPAAAHAVGEPKQAKAWLDQLEAQ